MEIQIYQVNSVKIIKTNYNKQLKQQNHNYNKQNNN